MPVYTAIDFHIEGSLALLSASPSEVDVTSLAKQILQALADVDGNKAVRALVLSVELPLWDIDSAVMQALRCCPVPIVSVISGRANQVALSGDIILAAPGAVFERQGESVSAEQALALGLVNACVEEDELLPQARQWAQTLSQGPTQALVMTRQLVDEGANNSFAAQYRRELEVNRELRESADGKEGVQAFLEKRKPRFSGR